LEVASLKETQPLRRALEQAGARVTTIGEGGGRLGWIPRSYGLLIARRPDLVHTTLFEADIAGRAAATLAGIPVVSSIVTRRMGSSNDPTRVLRHRGCDWPTSRMVLPRAMSAGSMR